MDDYEMDEAESSGLDSLYAAEEEGEETANITSAASRGALMFGAPEIFSKYNEATKEYETSTQEVLRQMQAARDKLLNQPTEQSRGEQLRGIAMALAAPRERDDPRFYERRNLYTFLRDIGEYGAAQKAAQKKAEEEKQKQIASADFQIAQEKAKVADVKRRELAKLAEKYARPTAAAKEDEITRLQAIRDSLDLRDPKRAELNRRIAYLGGERGDKGAQATTGEKEVDKKVGAEYASWVIGGQGAQAASRISRINNVVSKLEDRKDISGPVVGYVVENLPTIASTLYPEAQDAKDVVESVVQTDLRAILGGQFAQKEGEALIKRAYNPRLQEWQNSRRLKLLSRQMQMVADEKNRAMNYFGDKGTIKGYDFKPYSANDFLTDDQLRRIDDGESVESILGETSLEMSKKEPKPKPSSSAAKTPAQKAAEELARRRAARGG